MGSFFFPILMLIAREKGASFFLSLSFSFSLFLSVDELNVGISFLSCGLHGITCTSFKLKSIHRLDVFISNCIYIYKLDCIFHS